MKFKGIGTIHFIFSEETVIAAVHNIDYLFEPPLVRLVERLLVIAIDVETCFYLSFFPETRHNDLRLRLVVACDIVFTQADVLHDLGLLCLDAKAALPLTDRDLLAWDDCCGLPLAQYDDCVGWVLLIIESNKGPLLESCANVTHQQVLSIFLSSRAPWHPFRMAIQFARNLLHRHKLSPLRPFINPLLFHCYVHFLVVLLFFKLRQYLLEVLALLLLANIIVFEVNGPFDELLLLVAVVAKLLEYWVALAGLFELQVSFPPVL